MSRGENEYVTPALYAIVRLLLKNHYSMRQDCVTSLHEKAEHTRY
jgi:hypothetical protein